MKGSPRNNPEAALFVGTLFNNEDFYATAREKLISFFGPIETESQTEPWDYTAYYDKELGTPIYRRFIFFRNPIKQGELSDIKLNTNGIEADLSINGNRRINLDPGYLTLSKIVLATTKDYSHRIYLGNGIFAETSLIFKNGTFIPHIFTYPDFRDEKNVRIFVDMRERFKERLKGA